jgi:hypothetical protein
VRFDDTAGRCLDEELPAVAALADFLEQAARVQRTVAIIEMNNRGFEQLQLPGVPLFSGNRVEAPGSVCRGIFDLQGRRHFKSPASRAVMRGECIYLRIHFGKKLNKHLNIIKKNERRPDQARTAVKPPPERRIFYP